MRDELVVDVVEAGEVISLFADAEGSRPRRKTKLKAKSTADYSPGLRPVRNDKACAEGLRAVRDEKVGAEGSRPVRHDKASAEGLRPVRNDKVCSEGLRPTRNDKSLRAMTPKELGEMAEAEFLSRALEMGVAVAKPWGDSRSYDFIVDDEGKLCRVQVKAAFSEGNQGSYSLRAHKHSLESYTEKDIDALAGYVNPVDAWYLFPVRVVKKLRSLKLFPGSKKKRSKYEKWREAWWVVRK